MNEGDWARFSCTVKKGTLQWKIGNYTKEEGDALNKIEARGLITVRKYDVVITMDRMYNGPICFRIAHGSLLRSNRGVWDTLGCHFAIIYPATVPLRNTTSSFATVSTAAAD